MQGRLENELKIQIKVDNMLCTMPNYVNEWYLNLKASRCTPSTCKDYVAKIKKFLEYIDDDVSNVKTEQINLQAIESYFISIQVKTDNAGYMNYTSDSYQISVWYAIDNFLNFLHKRKYIDEVYTSYIHKPKNKDLDRINENRILLTQKDFKKMMSVVKNGGKGDKTFSEQLRNRDILIMSLFMLTGMRETALTEINIDDFNLETNTLQVIDKGNKTHYYPLNSEIISVYTEWLTDRSQIVDHNQDALFVNYKGERISSRGISKMVKKYSELALGYPISPHKLRSGFCSILYEKTHDTEFVRRAVGHSSIRTTQRYIKTDNNERKKASEIMNNIINI